MSVAPDVSRYAPLNRNADKPMHGMVSGGIRAMIVSVSTFYIIIAIIAKVSPIAG